MKLLYEIISLFNHDYMLKLSLKINDGYLVNNHLFQNLEKKEKIKNLKRDIKIWGVIIVGAKPHAQSKIGSGVEHRNNI